MLLINWREVNLLRNLYWSYLIASSSTVAQCAEPAYRDVSIDLYFRPDLSICSDLGLFIVEIHFFVQINRISPTVSSFSNKMWQAFRVVKNRFSDNPSYSWVQFSVKLSNFLLFLTGLMFRFVCNYFLLWNLLPLLPASIFSSNFMVFLNGSL